MVSKLGRRRVPRLSTEGGMAHMTKAKIRQVSPLFFHCEGENQLYSPALEAAGVHYTGGAISINAGLLTIKRGMRWRSFTMASHKLLVFFGLSPLGVLSQGFVYGLPIACKASMLHHQLTLHRRELELSRRKVAEIFTEDLQRAGYPFARFVGLVTRWFMPRGGWPSSD
jgi:hypothetical protein